MSESYGVLEECTPASIARTVLEEFSRMVTETPDPAEEKRLSEIHAELSKLLQRFLVEET